MRLLIQILWGRQSKWQFIIGLGGFLIGLIILLLSVQLYTDVDSLLAEKDTEDNKSYLLINKQVTLMNTFDKGVSYFKQEEIDTLEMQPFIDKVGRFSASTFKLNADMGEQLGFAFDLFFEAVPNEYLDTIPEEFRWTSDTDTFIPIMISSEFIRLYNLGVAMTQQNLPQLPPQAIQMYPFKVTLSGNGQSQTYRARVVGYTDRIPSVLVPQAFMDYANKRFGSGAEVPSNRLILQVEDPGSEALQQYLAENYYETNQEQLRISNLAKVLKVVVTLAGAVGLLFVVMALVIIVINFQLIISRAKEEIGVLKDIGYRNSTIANIMIVQFTLALVLTMGVALALVYYATGQLHATAARMGVIIDNPFGMEVVTAGVVSVVVVLLINILSLRVSLRN